MIAAPSRSADHGGPSRVVLPVTVPAGTVREFFRAPPARRFATGRVPICGNGSSIPGRGHRQEWMETSASHPGVTRSKPQTPREKSGRVARAACSAGVPEILRAFGSSTQHFPGSGRMSGIPRLSHLERRTEMKFTPDAKASRVIGACPVRQRTRAPASIARSPPCAHSSSPPPC